MKKIKIAELGKVVTGKTPPTADSKYWDGDFPFITPKDIKENSYYVDTERHLSKYWLDKSPNQVLLPNSICFVCIGATIGKVCLVKSHSFCNQQINAVIPNQSTYDNKFIFYLLGTLGEQVKALAGGAATPIVNKSTFSEIEIDVPNLEIQRKISSILSAYDDLIENNNRRITVLEEMARNLYREWFVKFQFPGHEAVKMVDSELGQIPEGWEVVNCPEAIEINPTVKMQKDNINPFVPMDALSENSMIIKYNEPKKGNSGSKFMNGDTLFARITPSLENGKTGYVQFLSNVQSVGFGSTEFIVLRSKLVTPEYVYCLARSNKFRDNAIKSMTGASGRQRVQNECFNNFMLALPTKDALDSFSGAVKPMFDSIYNLHQRNSSLQAQRDMLLPKLISGKIKIQ